MTELVLTPTSAISAPLAKRDLLDLLISRVAAGDRAAFRRLYAFMAMRVWQIAARAPLGRPDAVAVMRSTFVEVWHSAGAAARYDARDWMATVTTGRVNDRLRIIDPYGCCGAPSSPPVEAGHPHRQSPDAADYDAHVHRELTALLGIAGAIIRTGPGRFARIDNLDDAPAAIARTWCGHGFFG